MKNRKKKILRNVKEKKIAQHLNFWTQQARVHSMLGASQQTLGKWDTYHIQS